MKKPETKVKSLAAAVALTTTSSCSTVVLAGEVEGGESVISSSLQPQQSVIDTQIDGSVAVVEKIGSSNHQPIANRQTPRNLIAADSNYAPGCGQSTGTYHSIYLGCFDDHKDDRAFPVQIPSIGHGTLDCERECTSRRYRYFGRQFKGQCFCGSDLNRIVRHGTDSGCNCCGENVGGGKQCVWEDTKHAEYQQDSAPVTTPGLVQDSPLFAGSAPVGSLSFGSPNIFDEPAKAPVSAPEPAKEPVSAPEPAKEPEVEIIAQAQNAPTSSTTNPTSPFRLRLYWQRGYNWQDSSSEKWWCAECNGNCSSGSRIYIRKCSQSARQKWVAVDKTIRFAPNTSLCMTARGVGSNNPIRLQRCNGGRDQKFDGVQSQGKFEWQPTYNPSRCVSQHHHPKDKEPLFPETCSKTRATKTTYWQVY